MSADYIQDKTQTKSLSETSYWVKSDDQIVIHQCYYRSYRLEELIVRLKGRHDEGAVLILVLALDLLSLFCARIVLQNPQEVFISCTEMDNEGFSFISTFTSRFANSGIIFQERLAHVHILFP